MSVGIGVGKLVMDSIEEDTLRENVVDGTVGEDEVGVGNGLGIVKDALPHPKPLSLLGVSPEQRRYGRMRTANSEESFKLMVTI